MAFSERFSQSLHHVGDAQGTGQLISERAPRILLHKQVIPTRNFTADSQMSLGRRNPEYEGLYASKVLSISLFPS
jgi:hypothetical protein